MAVLKDFAADQELQTPIGYRAPELCQQSGAHTCISNIWCIGCTMAEVVLGRPLFDMEDDEPIATFLDRVRSIVHPEGDLNPGPLHGRLLDVPHRFNELGANLIQSLLVYEPRGRLTVQDAIGHPYFSDFDPDMLCEYNNASDK
ncbi:PREDICTED: cyclin-dependent kinase 1-like [Prunus mume]|uniref:Cyclin-dependent kinase 1-like n=1 Tax=Prunus mume TaxID=102107 RepID=A0ABM1LQU4_PRUMU|nr:PREDICTED: cyclin-dependent kinase 1-like [Prunus mume]